MQRRRQEGQEAQKRLEEFRDVLEVVKNTLGNGAGALARKRGENSNLTAQIEEKRVNLEVARRKYQVMFNGGGVGPKRSASLQLFLHHGCGTGEYHIFVQRSSGALF